MLELHLPAALAIGDRVGVRLDPAAFTETIVVVPAGSDAINGFSAFTITTPHECVTFVVGAVAHWWIESDFYRSGFW